MPPALPFRQLPDQVERSRKWEAVKEEVKAAARRKMGGGGEKKDSEGKPRAGLSPVGKSKRTIRELLKRKQKVDSEPTLSTADDEVSLKLRDLMIGPISFDKRDENLAAVDEDFPKVNIENSFNFDDSLSLADVPETCVQAKKQSERTRGVSQWSESGGFRSFRAEGRGEKKFNPFHRIDCKTSRDQLVKDRANFSSKQQVLWKRETKKNNSHDRRSSLGDLDSSFLDENCDENLLLSSADPESDGKHRIVHRHSSCSNIAGAASVTDLIKPRRSENQQSPSQSTRKCSPVDKPQRKNQQSKVLRRRGASCTDLDSLDDLEDTTDEKAFSETTDQLLFRAFYRSSSTAIIKLQSQPGVDHKEFESGSNHARRMRRSSMSDINESSFSDVFECAVQWERRPGRSSRNVRSTLEKRLGQTPSYPRQRLRGSVSISSVNGIRSKASSTRSSSPDASLFSRSSDGSSGKSLANPQPTGEGVMRSKEAETGSKQTSSGTNTGGRMQSPLRRNAPGSPRRESSALRGAESASARLSESPSSRRRMTRSRSKGLDAGKRSGDVETASKLHQDGEDRPLSPRRGPVKANSRKLSSSPGTPTRSPLGRRRTVRNRSSRSLIVAASIDLMKDLPNSPSKHHSRGTADDRIQSDQSAAVDITRETRSDSPAVRRLSSRTATAPDREDDEASLAQESVMKKVVRSRASATGQSMSAPTTPTRSPTSRHRGLSSSSKRSLAQEMGAEKPPVSFHCEKRHSRSGQSTMKIKPVTDEFWWKRNVRDTADVLGYDCKKRTELSTSGRQVTHGLSRRSHQTSPARRNEATDRHATDKPSTESWKRQNRVASPSRRRRSRSRNRTGQAPPNAIGADDLSVARAAGRASRGSKDNLQEEQPGKSRSASPDSSACARSRSMSQTKGLNGRVCERSLALKRNSTNELDVTMRSVSPFRGVHLKRSSSERLHSLSKYAQDATLANDGGKSCLLSRPKVQRSLSRKLSRRISTKESTDQYIDSEIVSLSSNTTKSRSITRTMKRSPSPSKRNHRNGGCNPVRK